MRNPVILPLMALAAGIVTATAVPLSNALLYTCLPGCILCLLFAFMRKRTLPALMALVLAFYFLGALHINLYLYPKSSKKDVSHFVEARDPTAIEGVLTRHPRVRGDTTCLVMDSVRVLDEGRTVPVHGKVQLILKGGAHRYNYGDYVRAETRLKTPHSFRNPGGFDYERYLLFQGIRVRGYVTSPSRIVTIRENCGNPVRGVIERYRTTVRATIAGAVPEPERGLLRALLLGEQDGITDEVRENFNRAGLTHILAISGLHVGIVAFLSFFFIRTLMKGSEYLLLRFNIVKISALFSIVPIIGYACIAGFRISTIRATIMILAFAVGLLIGRERSLLNVLAFAALAILFFDPTALFDVSFQLSFAAATSILLVAPQAQSFIYGKISGDVTPLRRLLRGSALLTAVSLAALAGTAPLTALYFNRISTLTLLSNLLLVPLIGFAVLPLGIISTVAVLLSPPLAACLFRITGFFLALAESIVDVLASLPFALLRLTTPSFFEIILCYFCLFAAIRCIVTSPSGRRRLPFVLILAVLLPVIVMNTLWFHYQDRFGDRLDVTFIDVGQGSSTLIKFPGGKKMLVDGGGLYDAFDFGKYVVAPFLLHEKITKLDVVVLTHPDRDHLGGLLYIVNHFEIGELWTNGRPSDTDICRDFMTAVARSAIPHRIMRAGSETPAFGKAAITLLNPLPTGDGNATPQGNANDNGIVMKIEYDDVSLLLPADISGMAEARIATGDRSLKSTVLLVPHHGSRTSSTQPFVKAVRPDLAVISCGFRNAFGLPHEDVVNRYEDIGAVIFRTDLDGAVSFVTDGSRVTFRTERRRCGSQARYDRFDAGKDR